MIRELKLCDYDLITNLGLLITSNFSTDKISNNETILVYEINGKIVGFIEYLKNYETIDIINIAVLDEFRRDGIGSKFIDYLIENNDIEHIMLEVRKSNEIAIKFYEKNGFKVLREIKGYYGNEDALSMEKVIK